MFGNFEFSWSLVIILVLAVVVLKLLFSNEISNVMRRHKHNKRAKMLQQLGRERNRSRRQILTGGVWLGGEDKLYNANGNYIGRVEWADGYGYKKEEETK